MRFPKGNFRLITIGVSLFALVAKPLRDQNVQRLSQEKGWDKVLEWGLGAMPDWATVSLSRLGLEGFWAGAFVVLLVWGCLEALQAVRRWRRQKQGGAIPFSGSAPRAVAFPQARATVTFDPTSYDGTLTIGDGDATFVLHFFRQDAGAIGISKSGTNLRSVARIRSVRAGERIDIGQHDRTSRDYVVSQGEHFVVENDKGSFLIGRIDGVDFEGRRGAEKDEVRFTYKIDMTSGSLLTAI